MTNAPVFLEACALCGRVNRTYLGRRARRRTPLICPSCARPWIKWGCSECGTVNHEQVDILPKRGAHEGVCFACGARAYRISWTRSSREEAAAQQESQPASAAHPTR